MDKFFTYYNAGTILLVAFVMAFMPKFTKKDIAFGVNIPVGQKGAMPIRGWERRYGYFIIVIGIVLTAAILLFAKDESLAPYVMGGSMIVLLVAVYSVYYQYHRKVKALKQSSDWQEAYKGKVVVNLSSSARKAKFSSWWYLIYLVIILVSVTISILMLPSLPDILETHFDAQGQVDGWMEKGKAVWLMPLTQLGLSLLLFLMHLGINRAKFHVDPEDKEGSSKRQSRFRTHMAIFIFVLGITILLNFLVSHLMILTILPSDPVLIYAMIIAMAVVIVVMMVLVYMTGQSGWRIGKEDESTGDSTVIKRDEDKYYKLGIFYFNTKDPALMVEKRFGIGWTFNFGNPIAWVVLVIIAVIIIISVTR